MNRVSQRLAPSDDLPGWVHSLGLPVWASGEAARLLADLPDRWAHTAQVARHARWASVGLDDDERDLLIASAYLHDIGYADPIAHTGFHPLDGARHLRQLGLFDLACLVAHHSGAAVEAEHRGVAAQLGEFPMPTGAVADALTYSDVTSGPTGSSTTPGARFDEIVDRHGPDSVVAESRTEARPELYACVARTLRRVAAARPTSDRLAVIPTELGCSTLLQFQGSLDRATAAHSARVVKAALDRNPHRIVCDLALLRFVDQAGAAALMSAADLATESPDVDIVLADVPQRCAELLAASAAVVPRLVFASSVESVLVPHCDE